MFKLIKKLIKWSLISVAGLTALAVVLALTTEPMTPERLAQREADNQAPELSGPVVEVSR